MVRVGLRFTFILELDLGYGVQSQTCLLHLCVLHKERSSTILCKIVRILNEEAMFTAP